MPPVQVPGKGSGSGGSSEEEFDEEQLAAFLGSSLPDHHYGLLVGSLGALSTSLPRSLGGWGAAVDVYHAPTLDDVEYGRLWHGSDGEEEEGAEGDQQAAGPRAAAEAAAVALELLAPPVAPLPPSLPAGAAASGPRGDPASPPAAAAVPEGSPASKPPSEAFSILRLAAPLSVSNLAGYAISMVAIAFVGRLGEAALSVAVLATSVFNVTGLSVLIGFSSAMETFCGQAYGAGRYRLVGLVLQRALLLLSLVAATVAVVWTQAEPILVALGQDKAIAAGTAQFLIRATPALWCTAVFEALKRYLMAQEAVRPATVVTCVSLMLAPLYNWLFIFKMGLGLHGAAYAMDAVQATLALLLTAYCVARDRLLCGSPLATWHGFSKKAWTGWIQYCRFALPSVAMLCCEWSTFEVMVLMSGLLADPSVAVSAMGLCINTSGLAYMLVTGLACATSVKTSHALGARKPGAARRATWTAWGLTMCLQAVVAVSICLARNSWPRLFTASPAVVARTAELLPLFALSLFGDGTNAVLQGLLRGAGKQHMGAVTNLLSYWCCGIPLAAYLAFGREMGLQGLWWGLVVINTLQGGIMLTMAWLFDWEAQAERAAALLESEATNPLLVPLLLEEGEGDSRLMAAKSQRRRRAGAPACKRASDQEGIKARLSLALLLLLTEGAHQRAVPCRRAPGAQRQAQKTPAVSPEA